MLELVKKYLLLIVVGSIVIIFLFVQNDVVGESSSEISPDILTTDTEATDQELQVEQIVMIDVKGEVEKPGVYEMDMQSRVNDVIKKAGGFSQDADETQINLAQKVQDEMVINVPKVGEITAATAVDGSSTGTGKVKVNYATQDEIESLNGIGPSKAQAIIQYREENGPFQSIENLLEVSGIGEKTLENIQENVQIP